MESGLGLKIKKLLIGYEKIFKNLYLNFDNPTDMKKKLRAFFTQKPFSQKPLLIWFFTAS